MRSTIVFTGTTYTGTGTISFGWGTAGGSSAAVKTASISALSITNINNDAVGGAVHWQNPTIYNSVLQTTAASAVGASVGYDLFLGWTTGAPSAGGPATITSYICYCLV